MTHFTGADVYLHPPCSVQFSGLVASFAMTMRRLVVACVSKVSNAHSRCRSSS